jgi:hypothetical protein
MGSFLLEKIFGDFYVTELQSTSTTECPPPLVPFFPFDCTLHGLVQSQSGNREILFSTDTSKLLMAMTKFKRWKKVIYHHQL